MREQNAPKKKKEILQRDLEDGCVLKEPDQPRLYTLNISAALVWELCDGKHSIEEIAEELAKATGRKQSDVVGDVTDIVKDFQGKHLLQSGL